MAELKEKTERDFLTFDVKFNGLEELSELIKNAKQLVQILKEAQELINSLSGKVDIDSTAEKIADEIAKISEEEKQEEGSKEELDIPHEILKLIFDKYPEGVTIGESAGILKETRQLLDDTLIV